MQEELLGCDRKSYNMVDKNIKEPKEILPNNDYVKWIWVKTKVVLSAVEEHVVIEQYD